MRIRTTKTATRIRTKVYRDNYKKKPSSNNNDKYNNILINNKNSKKKNIKRTVKKNSNYFLKSTYGQYTS